MTMRNKNYLNRLSISEEETLALKLRAAAIYIKSLHHNDIRYISNYCCPDINRSEVYAVTNDLSRDGARFYVKIVAANYFTIYRVRPDEALRRLKRFPSCLADGTATTVAQWNMLLYAALEEIFVELNRIAA